jgi:hypothetical protein
MRQPGDERRQHLHECYKVGSTVERVCVVLWLRAHNSWYNCALIAPIGQRFRRFERSSVAVGVVNGSMQTPADCRAGWIAG